jgi:hypothetical protein
MSWTLQIALMAQYLTPCNFSFDVCGAFGKWKIILVGEHFIFFEVPCIFL